MLYLSPHLLARANKFHFIKHKRSFITARGTLRLLLGNYLHISPNKIKFEYNERGKPRLASSMGNSCLQFNVSHSQEYAVYGFTHHLIGVDVEYVREMGNITELTQRFFTHREFQLITNLIEKEQHKEFFQLWTAKEAYLKAIGTGLSSFLTDIELYFDDRNAKLLSIKGNMTAVSNWSMYHFTPTANYMAAVIVNTKTHKQQIDFWNW